MACGMWCGSCAGLKMKGRQHIVDLNWLICIYQMRGNETKLNFKSILSASLSGVLWCHLQIQFIQFKWNLYNWRRPKTFSVALSSFLSALLRFYYQFLWFMHSLPNVPGQDPHHPRPPYPNNPPPVVFLGPKNLCLSRIADYQLVATLWLRHAHKKVIKFLFTLVIGSEKH